MPAQSYEMPAAWGGSVFQELTVPSGGKVLCKRLDFEDIIAAGLMDEFDTLTPTVEDKVVGPAKGKKPQDRQPKKLTKAQQTAEAKKAFSGEGAQALVRILALMLPQLVVEPKVYPSLEQDPAGKWQKVPFADRVEGRVYTDSIPFPDQMHIFDWAMEGMDLDKLQQFREQPEPDLGGVEPQPKPAGPPE